MSLLSIRLTASYPGAAGARRVLEDLSLEIHPGEALGLVGESGSGKSTLALAVLRLLDWKGGSASGWLLWKGRDLMQLRESEMREVRGREIALVLQSAATALNPALKIGTQFREAWRAHSEEPWKQRGREQAAALLADVNLPDSGGLFERYPGQLSIGQAQRVLIALALLHQPDLLIADEPTSALDTITQREVLELLDRLRREQGMATLFISHDLLSVGAFCDRVAILEKGRIVETGKTGDIFNHPSHEYTRRLIAALPERPGKVDPDLEDVDLFNSLPPEYRERQSLANLANMAETDRGAVIPFRTPPAAGAPGDAMLKNQPPCAEASKPSAAQPQPFPKRK